MSPKPAHASIHDLDFYPSANHVEAHLLDAHGISRNASLAELREFHDAIHVESVRVPHTHVGACRRQLIEHGRTLNMRTDVMRTHDLSKWASAVAHTAKMFVPDPVERAGWFLFMLEDEHEDVIRELHSALQTRETTGSW